MSFISEVMSALGMHSPPFLAQALGVLHLLPICFGFQHVHLLNLEWLKCEFWQDSERIIYLLQYPAISHDFPGDIPEGQQYPPLQLLDFDFGLQSFTQQLQSDASSSSESAVIFDLMQRNKKMFKKNK